MTLWAADVGPYVWHEFDADRMRNDIAAVAAAGFRTLRLLLPWDAFMPHPGRVPGIRLRQLDTVLSLAGEQGIVTVPVLFAQALGDCVMLPAYAIHVDTRPSVVRPVTDAVVQPGRPKDQYTDSLLTEVQLQWIESLLSAFAGHPAIAMWDLGHDPAGVMRPRRTEQQRSWCARMSAAIHAYGQQTMLTLGADDFLMARGVRPALLAREVDTLGVAVDLDRMHLTEVHGIARTAFFAQLALRLSGGEVPLAIHVSTTERKGSEAERTARDTIESLVEMGCSGVHAMWWAECDERVMSVPPFDRRPDMARRGVMNVHGEPTSFGAGWTAEVAHEPERQPAQPWPAHIDIDDYYSSLPESLVDLQRSWDSGNEGMPAMLSPRSNH